jgi:S1-C subfamily serine protease
MNDVNSTGGGGSGPKPPSPAILLTLVLAVALLAGAVSGAAVALLNDSGSNSSTNATASVTPAPAALTEGFAQDAVATVVAKALPSVVAIINEFDAQGDQPGGTAGGAGVIIDDRGFIMTNAHLLQFPGRLFVLFNDGDVQPAQLVSHDFPYTDVGVIHVDKQGLKALPIGDSAKLKPGQTVIAIGSPDIDYYNSVSTGVVSAVGRRKELTNVWYEDLIQTDAAINVGNSGGPLITLDGEVVGINTFRDTGADDPLFGISFAVSSRTFAPIVQSMVTTGSFPRPYFGVDHVDLTPDVAQQENVDQQDGALIKSVTAGSPAAEAGLQPGDIVTMFGEIPLSSQFGLLNALGVTEPDAKVSLEVIRNGQTMTLDVQLEPR